MSQLLTVLMSQLNTMGHFQILGTDGFTVIAHSLQGLYSLEVLNPNQETTMLQYADLNQVLGQVKMHVSL